jgi:hypothetical protein
MHINLLRKNISRKFRLPCETRVAEFLDALLKSSPYSLFFSQLPLNFAIAHYFDIPSKICPTAPREPRGARSKGK